MKSKHYVPILTLAGAMFFSLPLVAQTMDHSMMNHEDHGTMQHDTHRSISDQQHDDGKHADNHTQDNHMQHGTSEHPSGASEHANNGGVMTHDMADHDIQSQHDAMQHSEGEHHAKSSSMTMESVDLPRLQTMPSSGKSREAGYDDRYVMEPTTAQASIATRCAQASRGLVMVDNATWAECGGKPGGWSKGVGDRVGARPAMDHSEHMGH
jgi:hypothetical protein